jgi:hypothetical protein
MEIHVKTLVFNEKYVNNFINYSLPSMLSPNNLPAMSRIADIEYHIYTHTEEEVNKIVSAICDIKDIHFPIKAIKVKTTAGLIDNNWYNSGIITHPQEQFFEKLANYEFPIVFSNADVVWSDGALRYLAQALLNGNVAIYVPIMRVVTETITSELDQIKKNGIINLPPIQATQILLRHFSPLFGAYNHQSLHFPTHCEIFFVPVGNEGILVYYPVRAFWAFVPNKFEIINTCQLKGNFFDHKVDTVRDGSQCLGLSFTELAYNQDWIRGGCEFNTYNIHNFMQDASRWKNAFNDECLKLPTRIPIVEDPDLELWNRIEKEIEDNCLKEILDGNKYRETKRVSSDSDKQLQIGALEWLEPVIDGRFPQIVLEFLRSR